MPSRKNKRSTAGSSQASASSSAGVPSTSAFQPKVLIGCFIDRIDRAGGRRPMPRIAITTGPSRLTKSDLSRSAQLYARLMTDKKLYSKGTTAYDNFTNLWRGDTTRAENLYLSKQTHAINQLLHDERNRGLTVSVMLKTELDQLITDRDGNSDLPTFTAKELMDAVIATASSKIAESVADSIDWDQVVEEILQDQALSEAASTLLEEGDDA